MTTLDIIRYIWHHQEKNTSQEVRKSHKKRKDIDVWPHFKGIVNIIVVSNNFKVDKDMQAYLKSPMSSHMFPNEATSWKWKGLAPKICKGSMDLGLIYLCYNVVIELINVIIFQILVELEEWHMENEIKEKVFGSTWKKLKCLNTLHHP